MSAHLHALTHGIAGLELAYLLVLGPLVAGFIRGRASWSRLLVSPLLALGLTLLASILIGLTSPLLRAMALGADGVLELGFGGLVCVALGYVAGRVLAGRESASGPLHRRGAIVSAAQPGFVWRRGRVSGPAAAASPSNDKPITLAGVPIPAEDETKHFKLIGTTGTGKSTAIREILSAALGRGDRAIIADPDGGYLSRFYDAGREDVILNPFEPKARKWDLFGEIVNDYDVEQLARSLIPDNGHPEDRTWSEHARTFLSALVQQAVDGRMKDDELFRLITGAPIEELRDLLGGTPAGPFLEEGNEKMFGSIRSTASSAVRALKYTTRQKASPFSVRQWVRTGAARARGGQGGVLFFPYKAGEVAALRSVISAWMRIAIFEAMDREEGDQRLWFVVDELDALGEIDGLKDALARLRKFGGRCVLGFQSIAQVSGTYGRSNAETIVENCGNTLILRCSASEHGGTSEFASKLIGQREVMHTTVSRTRRPTDWMASRTTSQHLRIEPAVMASEIERLPDLEGFLKLASVPDWQAVRLTPASEPAPVRPRRPSVLADAPTSADTASPSAAPIGVTVPVVAPRRRVSRKDAPKRTRRTKVSAHRAPAGTAAPLPMPSEDRGIHETVAAAGNPPAGTELPQ